MDISNVNWATLAGFHSQLTGVLSGFTFAALTLLLTNPPTDAKGDEQSARTISAPLYALLIVFFGLILASFLFAATTGENVEKTADRAAYRAIVASLNFAVAAPLMFVSLSWLFKSYGIASDVIKHTNVIAMAIAAAAGFYLVTSVTHMGPVLDPFRQAPYNHWRGAMIWPALLIPALGWLIRAVFKRPLVTRVPMRLERLATSAGILIFFICVYYGYVSDLPETAFANPSIAGAKYVAVVIVGVFLFFCGINLPEPKSDTILVNADQPTAPDPPPAIATT